MSPPGYVRPGYTVAYLRRKQGCIPAALVQVHITAVWKDGSISGVLDSHRISFNSEADLSALPQFRIVDNTEHALCYSNDAWRLT
jgi:hypothetical protein